ncbi:putative cell-wall-anchored protein [Erwinia phage vB_EamM-Bue1]|uniref:Putative cell-wall-anchored protein n=1 Tax=Erwinia phage vB_EamM-Bue1 TaxID=2099338 RepID=A0A2P1JUG0_9CAUD|nr:putative cell-wall-anchored protein [Erwinia phage vB_EamM-Bue1]AVO22989.1 putative cell-wall-anchored protein [Erwinia phage vB_EamM-Bue1]
MATETSGKYYFKGNFWAGGVIVDEYSVLQDENGDWWKYTGYRRTKPFNVMAGERPDSNSWVNVGTLMASGITDQDVTFDKGGKIENKNQFVLDEVSGMWYYWNGPLPKQVPPHSSVDLTGGVSSETWMPIEGLISQNLTNIRALQQLVSNQSETIILLNDMQVKQAGTIDQLQADQDTQGQHNGSQGQQLTAVVQRLSTLEKDSQDGSVAMDAVQEGMGAVSAQTDKNTTSIKGIHVDMGQLADSVNQMGQAVTTQNEVIANQTTSINAVKESTRQQTEVLSKQQESVSRIQISQSSLAARIDSNDLRDDTQDGRLDAQDTAITNLQNRVKATEQTDATQSQAMGDLDRRIGSQESKANDQGVTIKALGESVTAVQHRLDQAGTDNETRQAVIDGLKKTSDDQGTTLVNQGKAIQTNTDDIAALKKHDTDQDIVVTAHGKSIENIQSTVNTNGTDVSGLKDLTQRHTQTLSEHTTSLKTLGDSVQAAAQTGSTNSQAIQAQAQKVDSQGQAISTLNLSVKSVVDAVSTLQNNVGGWQTQVNALTQAMEGKFAKPTGSVSQYIRGDGSLATFPTINPGTVTSIQAGTGLEGGTITGSGTISMPNVGTAKNNMVSVNTDAQGRVTGGRQRVFNYPTRALNTAFQVSATQDANVNYTVDVSATSLLLGGTTGRVILEYADNAAMTTNLVTVNEAVNGTSGVLNVVNIGSGNVNGWIPAGKYVRIRTANTSGTAVFTFVRAEEVLQ